MTQTDSRIRVVLGDITRLQVDAIVNAANRSLLGGGGVDGAIHRAAGPDQLAESHTLGGCEPGDAKRTDGHALPARHVIHSVGPVWRGGEADEEEILASCYRRCLELAEAHELKSIAFPAISTGAFRFPLDLATDIAVEVVQEWLGAHELPEQVWFCCFDPVTSEQYRKVLGGG